LKLPFKSKNLLQKKAVVAEGITRGIKKTRVKYLVYFLPWEVLFPFITSAAIRDRHKLSGTAITRKVTVFISPFIKYLF